MSITVTKDGKALAKLILGIKRRTASLQNDIHIVAVSCVMHAVEFGNALPATQLIEAITGGSKAYAIRANALKKWFEEIGCFVWNNGEQPGFKMDAERRAILKGMDEAKAITTISRVPFWEYAPEPEYKGFDLNARLKSLIAQALKATAEHGDDVKTKVDINLVSTIQQLLVKKETTEEGSADFLMIEADTLEASNVNGTFTVN